jgi:hypothetical protein
MLDKYVARNLIPLVNTNNDALLEYAMYRLGILRNELETLVEINDILRIQGQIKELRRLITWRDEVLEDAKD